MPEPEVLSQTVDVPNPSADEPGDLGDIDLGFLADYTGCSDNPKLRSRVIDIWREFKAMEHWYVCLKPAVYLTPRFPWIPRSMGTGDVPYVVTNHNKAMITAVVNDYKAMILKDPGNSDPFLLEVGSYFGTNLRCFVKQGVTARSLIATDLTPDFWELGYKLYEDKDDLDVQSFFGSMSDSSFTSGQDAPLGTLCGKVHYVWAGLVLHNLSEEDMAVFLQNVFRVLRPGGTFFGDSFGSEPASLCPTPTKPLRYLNSQASLKEALERVGFYDVSVSQAVKQVPSDAGSIELRRNKAWLAFAAKKV